MFLIQAGINIINISCYWIHRYKIIEHKNSQIGNKEHFFSSINVYTGLFTNMENN